MEQNLCNPSAMNSDRNPATERIMSLILEIIWLLTGEDCVVVKKQDGQSVPSSSSADVSEGFLMVQGSKTDPTPRSQTPESNSSRKSLQPLPCEVPEREEDVAIRVTIEEREYGERHKKRHKGKAKPHKDRPPLNEFSDVSERSHLPAYTQEGLEENRLISPNYQMEPRVGMLPQQYKNDESIRNQMSAEPFPTQTAADRCPIPPYSRHCAHESGGILEIHQGYKEEAEETPTEMNSDEAISRNTAGTDHSPPYSQDFIHEENTSTQDFQMEQLDVIVLQQCKEEEIPAEISTGNPTTWEAQLDACPILPSEADFGNRSFVMDTSINGDGRKAGTVPESHPVLPTTKDLTGYNYNCRVCGRIFASELDFRSHQILHTNKKMYSCFGYEAREGLAAQQIAQNDKRTESLLYNSADTEQQQQMHAKKKSYMCLICGKCLSQKSDLIIHQRIHTEEKAFACTHCGKCFRHKSTLVIHQRIHTGEKPFVCCDCGKSFKQSGHHLAHRRIHTGERPFACTECGKSFKRKSTLHSHQRTHRRK
ncbi:oocyte zinc finger protein XlCOF7.1-like isoform X2 [Xenopus laevis]|nr:oocyte zinc finger protein XlCOF7.1-like isoform X2 [Xenopus laevis]